MTLCQQIRGYHPPLTFNVIGVLTAQTIAETPGTLSTASSLDGVRQAYTGLLIDYLVLHVKKDGSSGSTVGEFYRKRGAADTLLGSLTINASDSEWSMTTAVPDTLAKRTVLPGDRFYVQLASTPATAAEDATFEVSFT